MLTYTLCSGHQWRINRGMKGMRSPTSIQRFFAREKYRQSLAYLGTMSGKSLQPEALFFTQKCI